MNALTIISAIICIAFFTGAAIISFREKKNILKYSSCAVLTSLGWWSFCNSFFFASATIEEAWLWHKLSSIGWCGFVALTIYYFFALTNSGKKKMPWWKNALFFTPAIALICANLFGKTTSLAQKIVPSISGWGLTYENSITSVLLWAYLLYVTVYFSFGFTLLYKWSKNVKNKAKRKMAIYFIIVDVVTILLGVVTDIVFPLTVPLIPALASVCTAVFGIAYLLFICKCDVFDVNLVISSDDILKISNNPIFVMDENMEILKASDAGYRMLNYPKNELIGMNFADLVLDAHKYPGLTSLEAFEDAEAKLLCKDETVKDILLSASAAEDRQHNFLCMIVSCRDVTRQKEFQNELIKEHEKYKSLAKDYQRLANFDSLTGLPNRRYFFENLHNYEMRYRTRKEDFAVLFMDLDNFKAVNDLYGHVTGDEVLVAVANKLKVCADKNDFIARLGGDEFIIIIPYLDNTSIEQKLQRIYEEFSKKVSVNGEDKIIKLSAGSGVFSEIEDLNKLMQMADKVMYENKSKNNS